MVEVTSDRKKVRPSQLPVQCVCVRVRACVCECACWLIDWYYLIIPIAIRLHICFYYLVRSKCLHLKAWTISSSPFGKDLFLVIALVSVRNKARRDKLKSWESLWRLAMNFLINVHVYVCEQGKVGWFLHVTLLCWVSTQIIRNMCFVKLTVYILRRKNVSAYYVIIGNYACPSKNHTSRDKCK